MDSCWTHGDTFYRAVDLVVWNEITCAIYLPYTVFQDTRSWQQTYACWLVHNRRTMVLCSKVSFCSSIHCCPLFYTVVRTTSTLHIRKYRREGDVQWEIKLKKMLKWWKVQFLTLCIHTHTTCKYKHTLHTHTHTHTRTHTHVHTCTHTHTHTHTRTHARTRTRTQISHMQHSNLIRHVYRL